MTLFAHETRESEGCLAQQSIRQDMGLERPVLAFLSMGDEVGAGIEMRHAEPVGRQGVR